MAKMTREGYLTVLKDTRNKLELDLENMEKGHLSYFKEVAIKLRVLLIDKSGSKSLLKRIFNEYGFDVIVSIKFSIKDKVRKGLLPKALGEGLVVGVINNVANWFKDGDERINIFDAIERDEIKIAEHNHSYKKIIEVVSDKMGAHVDSTIKDEDLILHTDFITLGDLPIAQRAIYDTGKATLVLVDSILDFIKNGTEYEWIELRIND